ncbi:VWA domain-containing protein [Neobacillus niacini]|uniref:vWA domain-containing protein n=1 Tax=Neobacillus niacini TaxID=86668 RepID=UPI0007AB433B|nr:vWA domain-containing protein [Neobacillus niacini]MEC1523500.1 VWA domain-containing protein [Neobacillus niacini]
MFKKTIVCFIMFIYLFSLTNVRAEDSFVTSSRIEGVLVVDVSKSMLTSDPNKISNEAMKMFIDMSSLKGDKIGFIAYAGDVVAKKDLVKLQTEKDKIDLKAFIDSLGQYPNTDISVGLKDAIKALDASHEKDYRPMIVLLADGNNDVDEKKGDTLQQATDGLNAAVTEAKTKGYPVYVIGLNEDGTLNKDVLQNIATTTNGKFFETSSADDLPRILSEIFANHLKLKVVPVDELVGKGDFEDVTITIPNTNVLEANLSLVSSQPVEIKLFDPSGTEQILPSDKISLTKSKSYSMVKMISPVPGDWTLKVKGVAADKIDINFVFNYDLQLSIAPLESKKYKAGDTIKVEAFFEDNGQKVSNNDLYNTMKATLLVTDLETNQTKEIPLAADQQGYTGQFIIGNSENYQWRIKAEGNSFFRETPVQQISVQKAAVPVATENIPEKEGQPFPWTYVGLIGFAAILMVTLMLSYFKKRKKVKRGKTKHSAVPAYTFSLSNRKRKVGFFGQIMIEIRDEETGELFEAKNEKLKGFKGEFNLPQLFKLPQEFTETDQINFIPLTDFALLIFNKSNCVIEMNGVAVEDEYQRFRPNDTVRIVLKEANKSIYVRIIGLEKKKNLKHA